MFEDTVDIQGCNVIKFGIFHHDNEVYMQKIVTGRER